VCNCSSCWTGCLGNQTSTFDSIQQLTFFSPRKGRVGRIFSVLGVCSRYHHNSNLLPSIAAMPSHKTEQDLRFKAAKYIEEKQSESTYLNQNAERRVPRFDPEGKYRVRLF
jgi:hypothetical protein